MQPNTSITPPPKIYKANFIQSGTSNPTPQVFQNTIDTTTDWIRDDLGFYSWTTNIDYPGTNKIYIPGCTDDSSTQSTIPIATNDGYWSLFYGNNGGKLYFQLNTTDNTNSPAEYSSLFANDTPLSLPTITIYP